MTLSGAQRIRLGVFVAAALLLLAGAIAAVIGQRIWSEMVPFQVRYHESVSGLDLGSPVRFQGLRVGRVAAMRIAADDPTAIEVDLALEPGTVLYAGTTAQLNQAGLTGLTYINLMPGDLRGKALEPGTQLEAMGSFTTRITGEAEQIRVQIEQALQQANAITSDRNRQRVERLLDDTDMLIRNLNTSVDTLRPQIEAAIAHVDSAAADVAGFAQAGRRSLGQLDATFAEVRTGVVEVRTSVAEVNRVLGAVASDDVRATLVSMRSATARLDARLSEAELGRAIAGVHDVFAASRRSLAAAARVIDSVGLTVRAIREDLSATLRQLRETTEYLRGFSRDIARDPALLLRGREEGSR